MNMLQKVADHFNVEIEKKPMGSMDPISRIKIPLSHGFKLSVVYGVPFTHGSEKGLLEIVVVKPDDDLLHDTLMGYKTHQDIVNIVADLCKMFDEIYGDSNLLESNNKQARAFAEICKIVEKHHS